MCLGSIAKVIEVHRDGRAIVEHDGVRQEVLEMTVADDDIEPGDWVLVHAGFALERLTAARAREALALRGEAGDAGEAAAATTEEAPS